MKKLLILPCLLSIVITNAQLPDTDIFLVDMKQGKDTLVFGKPVNITKRKGYDNQPCFTADDKALYYVAIDTLQSEVYRYVIQSGKNQRITRTAESEYSPTPTADGAALTVVRVDLDSGQRAYRLPLPNTAGAERILGTDSIGYFCHVNDSVMAMFVLGETNMLQLLNLKTSKKKAIAPSIGRCMKLSADSSRLYFVNMRGSDWRLFELVVKTMDLNFVTLTVPDAEDFAVLDDGTFLMGSNGMLYAWHPNHGEDWKKVADFSQTIGSFYRIVVNHAESKIALVGYSGKKP